MNIEALIKEKIQSVLVTQNINPIDFEVEIPKDSTHGDFSSNVAMKLAKELKKSPIEIAKMLVDELSKDSFFVAVEAVMPGFINFKLQSSTFKNIISTIVSEKSDYGKSEVGNNREVMIEFGQPNTHKAFHVGHLKSAITGLSVVRLHENLGYKVIKANYFGDVGMHVAKATWGFLNTEVPDDFQVWDKHEKMKFIDDCYVKGSNAFKDNPQIAEEIKKFNKDIYAKVPGNSWDTYHLLRKYSLEHQEDVWKSLGVTFDRQYAESEVYENAVEIVKTNIGTIFEESDNAIIFRGEKVKLTNWVFLTSEGNPTYSAKDLGLATKKFQEYPNLFKSIVTTSVEQADYFKVVIHVLNLIKPETTGKYFHIPFGWMLKGGKKVSSRMGGSIKGMDILNEIKEVAYKKISELRNYSEEDKKEIVHNVANAGLKFLILSHEFHKDFSYEPEQFLSFEGFSGPYILYTYARANSILNKVGEAEFKRDDVSLKKYTEEENVLENESELNLLKLLAQYPNVALEAGSKIAPNLICNYVYEVAQSFNSFYQHCRVLNAEDEKNKSARLALTLATSQVLKNALALLGIDTVEKM